MTCCNEIEKLFLCRPTELCEVRVEQREVSLCRVMLETVNRVLFAFKLGKGTFADLQGGERAYVGANRISCPLK